MQGFIVWIISFCLSATQAHFTLGHLEEGSQCNFGGEILGTCLEARKCLAIGGVLDPGHRPVKICSVSAGSQIVCCRRPYAIAQEVCRAWSSYWRSNEGQCIRSENLIVGGEEAKVGQFPHIALVGLKDGKKVSWVCGGSLISPHYILTAAHCNQGNANYIVRVGDHDIFRKDKNYIDRLQGPIPSGLYREMELSLIRGTRVQTEQVRSVQKFIMHPDFESSGLYNDIALLLLDEPVILTKRVIPACIPTNPSEDYLGKNLTAAGWGKLLFHKTKPSRYLQKVTIPTIANVVCQESLQDDNPALNPKGMTSDQMCAGADGKDSCKGDSGGPLVTRLGVLKPPCEHTTVGIISFGPGCGEYGIYTRVSSYVDWITSIIAPKMIPKF